MLLGICDTSKGVEDANCISCIFFLVLKLVLDDKTFDRNIFQARCQMFAINWSGENVLARQFLTPSLFFAKCNCLMYEKTAKVFKARNVCKVITVCFEQCLCTFTSRLILKFKEPWMDSKVWVGQISTYILLRKTSSDDNSRPWTLAKNFQSEALYWNYVVGGGGEDKNGNQT